MDEVIETLNKHKERIEKERDYTYKQIEKLEAELGDLQDRAHECGETLRRINLMLMQAKGEGNG